MRDPVLSVVVPMYDEEEVLPMFFERMRPVLDGLGCRTSCWWWMTAAGTRRRGCCWER